MSPYPDGYTPPAGSEAGSSVGYRPKPGAVSGARIKNCKLPEPPAGVTVEYGPTGRFLGMYHSDTRSIVLHTELKRGSKKVLRNVIMAHEIGHAVDHAAYHEVFGEGWDDTNIHEREMKANVIADMLLAGCVKERGLLPQLWAYVDNNYTGSHLTWSDVNNIVKSS